MSKSITFANIYDSFRGNVPLKPKQVHKDANRYSRKEKHRKNWTE